MTFARIEARTRRHSVHRFMSMQSTLDVRATLNHLIQTCRDGQEGFLTAAENVNAEEIRRLFNEYSLQRAKFVGELQSVSHDLGDSHPENVSSVSGTLHRGWINLKTAVTGREAHSILLECERGEACAVSEYDKALALDLPAYLHEIVVRQHAEIAAAHERVKALSDAAAPKWA
jgi:uncharacterized protein (TIGR02284 family)